MLEYFKVKLLQNLSDRSFNISEGELTILSANAFLNSEMGRKPQLTPTDSTQALLAVSISTPESPI